MLQRVSVIILFLILPFIVWSQKIETSGKLIKTLKNPELVTFFYNLNGGKKLWTDTGNAALSQALLNTLDSSFFYGINTDSKKVTALKKELNNLSAGEPDSLKTVQTELHFTDAAITFMKSLYQGSNNKASYDEVSKKNTEADNRVLLSRLIELHWVVDFKRMITLLEPASAQYHLLKEELHRQIIQRNSKKTKELTIALGYLRWISHFGFEKYIVVNIPSASLYYYQSDSLALSMRAILGKTSTRTPRFAAYCNQVVLYPYWYVPTSIAVNELLPKFRRNPSLIDAMNMQVLDKAGKIISPSKINWGSLTRQNFPYQFRQSTGCDNSLGIIKFNLTSPFSIFMHDTNNKALFASDKRFYSHGCIRIENLRNLQIISSLNR
jgi:murein L,D-transpeptidase YcbB/YkuD